MCHIMDTRASSSTRVCVEYVYGNFGSIEQRASESDHHASDIDPFKLVRPTVPHTRALETPERGTRADSSTGQQ